MEFTYYLVALLAIVPHLHSIKVSFGTRNGPIVAPKPTEAPYYPHNTHVAPVWENEINDVPNPKPYKPYLPLKYRDDVSNHFNSLELTRRNEPNKHKERTLEDKHHASISDKGKTLQQRAIERETGNHGTNSLTTNQKDVTSNQRSRDYRGPQTFATDYEARPSQEYQFARSTMGSRQPRQWTGVGERTRQTVAQFGVVFWNGLKFYVPLGYDDRGY